MPIGNPIRKQNESRMVSVLATDGQTVFTVQGGYIINHISVFRNGVRLSHADDYTAGDGSTVTLNEGTNVNDRIDFHIFDRFTVQNAIVGAASSQTISGDLVVNGKIFGALDASSINLTGIVTATELDLNGKANINTDLTIERNLNVTGISTFKNNVHLLDSDRLQIGGSVGTVDGLEIYHDSSHSYIADSGTGELRLRTNVFNVQNAAGDETLIGATENDSVALYFNNNQKLVTTNDGVVVTGILTATGNLTLGATEFQLVDTGGYLHIRTNAGEDTAKFQKDGGTFLYFNNNQKLVTVTGGVDVTGSVTVTEGLLHSGDTDTKISFDTNTIKFDTNTNERLRITSTGKVGISSDAPTSLLTVGGGPNAARSSHPTALISPTSGNASLMLRGNSPTIDFDSTSGGIAQICTDNAALIVSAGTFEDTTLNAGEMVRIDASGRVLIGHSSPIPIGPASATNMPLQVIGDSYATSGMTLSRFSADGNGSHIHLVKSRNATKGSQTVVQVDDTIGFIGWYGSDGTDTLNRAAAIEALCDAPPASNKIPGRLEFRTTENLTYPLTRLTINSAGNSQFTGIVTATEFVPTVSQLSHRNKVINGGMTISQRHGTASVQLSATEVYTVDRFKSDQGSSFNITADASQVTDHPVGFSNALKIQCDATNTPTGGHNGGVSTFLEGQDVQDFGFGTSGAKPITVSFYAKSSTQNSGDTYGFMLGYSRSSDGARVKQTRSFTVTDTWQRFEFTFQPNGASQSSGIVNTTAYGLQLFWSLACGPDDALSEITTWTVASPLVGVSGQSNLLDQVNNQFFLTGVQVEIGNKATPFEFRSEAEELTRCQRYYQEVSRSSSNNSVDGTFASGTGNDNAGNGGILQVMVRFQQTMRTAPTMTQTGTFSHHVSGINVADTTIAFNQAYIDGIKITGTQTTFVHTDGFCGELISKYSDSSTASIKADAEI